MPYYREIFVNEVVPSSVSSNVVGQPPTYLADSRNVRDSTVMTSFRSGPHPMSIASTEVSDMTADPYAYFLDSTSRKKYHDRLNERGLKPKGSPDRGHSFELKRHILRGQLHNVARSVTTPAPGSLTTFRNALIYPLPDRLGWLDNVHDGRIEGPASYKETGLDAYAQQAYVKTAPTSVVFDAATFLGELREGLPRMIPETLKSGAGFFKSAGSDYLNVEFGWKPFIRDIQNAAKALSGATDMLAQQGKRVHRRHELPLITQAETREFETSLTVKGGTHLGFVPSTTPGWPTATSSSGGGGSAVGTLLKTRSVRRWFEGEFSSFLPLDFDPNDYLSRLNALVNTKITPATLWELAPWSWLVDWSLKIGDTIESNNMASNDLLVMHYGYAMETAVYTTEISWRLLSSPNTATSFWSSYPSRGRYFAATTYKRRLRANPYGFKVGGTASLTGGQAAILGALGLTKLK